MRTFDYGFIVADPTAAFVIETAGDQWVGQPVERALGINNVYSVESKYSTPTHGATGPC